jgi:hypothetical protein
LAATAVSKQYTKRFGSEGQHLLHEMLHNGGIDR